MVNSIAAATLDVSLLPAAPGSSADLSAEGRGDWAHWGLDATNLFNRKSGVTPQISDVTILGNNPAERDQFEPVSCSWTGGSPVAAVTNTATSLFVTGFDNGFELRVPASALLKRLRVYAGVYGAQGRFDAWLSENSVPSYSDASLFSVSQKTNGIYDIQFAAAAAGQWLIVQFKVQDQFDYEFGSVALQATTLLELGTNQPPFVSIVSPTTGAAWSANQSLPITVQTGDGDGTVQKVEFFANAVKIGESTNAPFNFVWTTPSAGQQSLYAIATDNQGARTRSATVTIDVHTGQGLLAAHPAAAPPSVNLAAEGRADWAHWGLQTELSFNHKAGLAQQIGNYKVIGQEPAYNYFDNVTAFTWSDGTPTTQAQDTRTGVYVVGLNNGFEVRIPADTTLKTARLYVGAYGARGRFTARLSDYSARTYVDTSLNNQASGTGMVYQVQYKASGPGESLILSYTVAEMHDGSFGNVTLQAATLVSDNDPPHVAITQPANGSSALLGSPVQVQAQAADPDGSITRLELFANGGLVGAFTQPPFSVTLSNLGLGTHTLTARSTDNEGASKISAPSLVHVIVGGGFLQGSFTSPPPANVNLTSEGGIDWSHWGLDNRRSYNHKSGVRPELGDLSSIGTSFIRQYNDNYTGFSWSDGTPARNAADTHSGFFVYGAGKGFELNIAASTTLKRVKIYCGLYSAKGRFEARLSDFSAAPYMHDGLQRVFANGYAVYNVVFAAASANQTLRIRWVAEEVYDALYGNVTWQAASLGKAPRPPLLTPLGFTADAPIRFVFPTEVSFNYTVEYTDKLHIEPWLGLTNFMGNGSNRVVSDPLGPPPGRTYRVRVE